MDFNKTNVMAMCYMANGCKLDESFFKRLYVANGGSLDMEDKLALSMLLKQKENQPKHITSEASVPLSTDEDSTACSTVETELLSSPPEVPAPTFCDIFPKGEKILLYGKQKIGKTPMTVGVASSGHYKNPLLFLIDNDDSRHQFYRKQLGNSNNGLIFSSARLEAKRQEIEDGLRPAVAFETMLEDSNITENPKLSALQKLPRKVNNKLGRSDLNSKRCDKLRAVEVILSESIEHGGVDLVIIDSLLALLDNDSRKLSGKFVKRILDIVNVHSGLTFILIHHENDSGGSAGPSAIKNGFDAVYHLESAEAGDSETVLRVTTESHSEKPEEVWIGRTFKDNVPTHVRIEGPLSLSPSSVAPRNNHVPVKDAIMGLVNSTPGIVPYDTLLAHINCACGRKMNVSNVKKQLLLLEDKSLIIRADGKTWTGGIKKA